MEMLCVLLLLCGSLLVLCLLPLLPCARIPGICAGETQFPERVPVLVFLGDGTFGQGESARVRVDREGGGDREGLDGRLDFFGRGVALLGFVCFAREEDQFGLVPVEAGNVRLQRFYGMVAAAVVHGDADGQCELAGDFGLLFDIKSLDDALSSREWRVGG